MSGDSGRQRIAAVLYDFGGVFVPSPFGVSGGIAARLGIDPAELTERVFGPYHLDTDHPWHRLERGEITFDAARQEIMAMGALGNSDAFDPLTLLSEFSSGGMAVREYMIDTVREVRAYGVATAIVTNNLAEFGSSWRSLLDLDELFDAVIDSSAVGVRKPDPEIYRLACAAVDVDPAAALFIDDHEGNVDGARRAGLIGVCAGLTDASARAAAELLSQMVISSLRNTS